MIPESHSLQQLFTELIAHHFDRDIGLRDPEVKDYVVNVLAEFCECEQLFKICDAEQRPLHDVGEMLLEADPVYGPAPSFDRERQVRKHIGDYTLFLSGMFPESVNHYRLRRQRLENFILGATDITSGLASGGGQLGGLLTVRDQNIPNALASLD